MYQIHSKFSVVLLAVLVTVVASSSAFGAATIVIQNIDAAGVGFNDSTPVAPVGGNPGTTLGQQRLNAFQFAANIWGATLSSTSTITVRANWEPLTCGSNMAVLGSAGTVNVWRDFTGAPFASTWYSSALANKLAGADLSSSTEEIRARFNVNIGNPGCFESTGWYYGLDNNHGNNVNLVTVLLHELAHGLGFQTFTNSSTGAQFNSGGSGPLPSIYDRFLFDNTSGIGGKSWVQMTDAERQASAINAPNLVWIGSQVVRDVPGVLSLSDQPRLKVNSPAPIAGTYQVGTAAFGPPVSSPGITGNVVQALDAADSAGPTTMDACSALTNAGSISGNIAMVDRGVCTFVTKVKNAQNAGAIGVIVANNQAGILGMAGTDGTITVPSLLITQPDGNTIKAQLGSGVNANLGVDPLVRSGADPEGRPQLNTPNPVESGSSVSHWDTSAFPNQLMEPDISDDLTHNVIPPDDLTLSLMRDIGWTGTPSSIPNPIDDARAFVRRHYLDFLGREPDQDGLDYWTGQITLCGNDLRCVHNRRIDVSAAFFVEQEFQRTGSFIYRLFKGGLGRRPSFPEFTADRSQIVEGPTLEATKQAFALFFVGRSEFTTKYGGLTSDVTFVNALIQSLGVSLSSQQRQSLIDKYNTGSNMNQSRAFALREAIDITAFVDAEYNPAFVLMQYFGYLVRDPDQGGFLFWLDVLNNRVPGNFRSMVCAFVTSDEYQHRFGSAITRSNQDCGP